MLPTKFRFIWPCGFKGEDFQKSTIQKQELPVGPCLLTDRDEMSNRYRGPSKDASYQVSFTWPTVSEEKIFQKSTNQKQELPVVAMFANGSRRNEQSLQRTFHRCSLPSSVHLAEGFQRRRLKCEKLTDRRRMPSDGKNSHCLWQGDLKNVIFTQI